MRALTILSDHIPLFTPPQVCTFLTPKLSGNTAVCPRPHPRSPPQIHATFPHLVKAPFLQLLPQDFTDPGQAPHWLFPHGLCHEVSVLLGSCHLEQD